MFLNPQDLLAQAIAHARAGENDAAQQKLQFAARIDKNNPRVWMWMAAVSDDDEAKRRYFEKVLSITPGHPAAQLLLNRLNAAPIDPVTAQIRAFNCPRCGGRMHFDPDHGELQCIHCGYGEPLALPNAGEAEQPLTVALMRSGAGSWAMMAGQLLCQNCGATTLVPADQTATLCPFCASPKVLTQPLTPGLTEPTAIGLFVLKEGQAREKWRRWLASGWFLPSNATQISYSRGFHAIYLPFWTFDGCVQVACRRVSQAGRFSSTERITRSFQIGGEQRLSQWWFEYDVDDLLIYAAHSVPPKVVQGMLPFNLKGLVAYQPEILAGWSAQVYQTPLADATVEAHQVMRDRAVRAAEKRHLAQRARLFTEDVRILQRTYKLVLLPVWVATYMYQGKLYHALINGETGKVGGERPIDWFKIGLILIGIALGVMLLLWHGPHLYH